MATTVATPVLCWTASLHSGSALANSSILSAVLFLTGQYEASVPFTVFYASQVSGDAVVSIFPSSDGGNNYPTISMTSFSIARTASAAVRQNFMIRGPGIFQIQVLNASGPQVNSICILTQEILTAYIGV